MVDLNIHNRFASILDAIGKRLEINDMTLRHRVAIQNHGRMKIGHVVFDNPITKKSENLPCSIECVDHVDAIREALRASIPWLNEFLMDLNLEQHAKTDTSTTDEYGPRSAGYTRKWVKCKKYTGEIHLLMGPMGSGKTDMLMREIRINRVRKRECIIIKHSNDDERGGVDCVKTKYGLTDSGHSTTTLKDKQDLVKDYRVIGIDEGQFFSDLVEMCVRWADDGKIVIVAALNGDYRMEPFDQVSRLIPKCDKILTLQAICAHCQNYAPFTRRLVEMGNVQNIPGGFDIYSPVCRKCYHTPIRSM